MKVNLALSAHGRAAYRVRYAHPTTRRGCGLIVYADYRMAWVLSKDKRLQKLQDYYKLGQVRCHITTAPPLQ